MHVIVCVKQVLDPEIPPRDFRVDAATNKPVQGNARFVLDSYAENALEMAIQLKENAGAKVTAICVGDKSAEEALRRAFAMTADAAVRVWDDNWTSLDGMAIGHILGRAVKALGGADLILAGRQAGDVEEGIVGPVLAEELGAPCVTLVSKLSIGGGSVSATREADGGVAVVAATCPAVVTVTSSDSNVPRLPKVKDQMLAKSKPIKLLGAAEIAADPAMVLPGTMLERAYIDTADVACEILPGKEGPESAELLAGRLKSMNIL